MTQYYPCLPDASVSRGCFLASDSSPPRKVGDCEHIQDDCLPLNRTEGKAKQRRNRRAWQADILQVVHTRPNLSYIDMRGSTDSKVGYAVETGNSKRSQIDRSAG